MLDQILVPAAAGVAAGLGVAMPLGAVAALLLREGLANGFRVAAAGASGVATVDLVYCLVASLAGVAVAPLVADHQGVFLVVSGVVVLALGVHQLAVAVRRRTSPATTVERTSPAAAYAKFVGLTAVNPMTLVYFVALAGAVSSRSTTWVGPFVFVVAVGLSSWAWQLLLAAVGAFAGRSLGPRAAETVGVFASAVVIALGCAIVASGLAA
ncbi:LysE family transporter [Nocardioides daphniae]|uniref:LysE family transporter n=1 Tax=Nocardioides daphniae TaxID=402297 RepID=UPI001E4E8EA6|nr:LysE family transporter [Nocardioides daphniae]